MGPEQIHGKGNPEVQGAANETKDAQKAVSKLAEQVAHTPESVMQRRPPYNFTDVESPEIPESEKERFKTAFEETKSLFTKAVNGNGGRRIEVLGLQYEMLKGMLPRLVERINTKHPDTKPQLTDPKHLFEYLDQYGAHATYHEYNHEQPDGTVIRAINYFLAEATAYQYASVDQFSDPHFPPETQRGKQVLVRRFQRVTPVPGEKYGSYNRPDDTPDGAVADIFKSDIEDSHEEYLADEWEGIITVDDLIQGAEANEGGHASFNYAFPDENTAFVSTLLRKGYYHRDVQELYSDWKTLERAPIAHTLYFIGSIGNLDNQGYRLCRDANRYAYEKSGFKLPYIHEGDRMEIGPKYIEATKEKGLTADPEFVRCALAYRSAFYEIFVDCIKHSAKIENGPESQE